MLKVRVRAENCKNPSHMIVFGRVKFNMEKIIFYVLFNGYLRLINDFGKHETVLDHGLIVEITKS